MQIYKEFTFEAALFMPSGSADAPKPRLLGHSFQVRVMVEGEPDPATGRIVRLSDIAGAMKDVHDALDHRFLNEDVEDLGPPTLENLAVWIWKRLETHITGLSEVHISRPACHEGCVYRGRKA